MKKNTLLEVFTRGFWDPILSKGTEVLQIICSSAAREAQIRYDARKLNYFAEQIKFCQKYSERFLKSTS